MLVTSIALKMALLREGMASLSFIRATLQFSNQLLEVFPEETPWPPAFLFSEDVREITTGLSDIRPQISDWLPQEKAFLDSIGKVSPIDFTVGHIRTENRSSFICANYLKSAQQIRPP